MNWSIRSVFHRFDVSKLRLFVPRRLKIEDHGGILGRDELMQTIWNDSVVEVSNSMQGKYDDLKYNYYAQLIKRRKMSAFSVGF